MKNKIFNKGDIIAFNGDTFNLTKNSEKIKLDIQELKSLCRQGYLIYDRTQWGSDYFIAESDYNKLTKKDLNKNIHLSEGNIKSYSTEDTIFLTWSLPSRKTCPFATNECRKRCFAKKNETFASVRESRERNLAETKKDTFVNDMIEHFEYHLCRAKTKDKLIIVRIHTSGDFYSLEYFEKWYKIASHFRNEDRILFQAYTKSIEFVYEWIKGDFEDYEVDDGVVEEGLDELNIHLVYSVWHDTPKEDKDLAESLGLQTFTALPKEKIEEIKKDKTEFICSGNCGSCKECYTGNSLRISIPYH